MSDLIKNISAVDDDIARAHIKKSLLLEKALSSKDVETIFKANKYLESITQSSPENENSGAKSMLIDPMALNMGLGYLEKPLNVSFQLLRNMGNIHVIRSIVQTRTEQILDFSTPQKDKYSTGFVIRPKKANRAGDSETKISSQQERRIDELTEIILNCGDETIDKYSHDSLDKFLRKFLADSLTLDQGCFEKVRNNKGELAQWLVIDSATIRVADTINQDIAELRHKYEEKNGYLPFYVQIYLNKVVNQYYPDEIFFGVRNPQTSIYANGYGRSELEDLISTVTSILNADQYNANYFKVGSNPKGILKVTGNVNQARIDEFRTQWQASMAGVRNAHKLPIIEAEKMDFISTQQSNKDMEYGKYYDFLIKLTCAVYKIDPAEIGFQMTNTGGNGRGDSLFNSNNEARLEYSKDKGLKPLLRFVQSFINKHILSEIDPNYEFLFVGFDAEDAQKELEDYVKKVQNFMTVNEVRRVYGLKDIEGGDIILSPIMMQQKQIEMQSQMQQESNAFMDSQGYNQDKRKENPFEKSNKNDDPFMKEMEEEVKKLFTKAA